MVCIVAPHGQRADAYLARTLDLQGVLSADPHGVNVFHSGPQAGTLHQSSTARIVPRAARRYSCCRFPTSRSQDVDLREH